MPVERKRARARIRRNRASASRRPKLAGGLELAEQLRQTGFLPQEQMARLQDRIAVLLREAFQRVGVPWQHTEEQAETVLLALHLAQWVPRLWSRLAKYDAKIAFALSALIEVNPATGEFENRVTQRRLRDVANRLRDKPDGTPLRDIKPADLILADWENLTGAVVEKWQRPGDRANPAARNWRNATDPNFADPKKVVPKREALRILKERYRFQTEVSCLQFLSRKGVKGLPAIRER